MSVPAVQTVICGDCRTALAGLASDSVQCCVTSPPYFGLRDYGVDGQIGLEASPDAYVAEMVAVFMEVRRVLRPDGVMFLNLGDSYAGSGKGGKPSGSPHVKQASNAGCLSVQGRRSMIASRRRDDAPVPRSACAFDGLKPKDLMMIPWLVALALQADGWWLRSIIVWHKKSPMPESCVDRPTSAWEPIFLLAKGERYYYDAVAVREVGTGLAPGNVKPVAGVEQVRQRAGLHLIEARATRNQRNVWTLGPAPSLSDDHYAAFPSEIPRRAIKAGTSEKGACPACGSPWRRITERTQVTRERPNALTKRTGENGTGNHCANTVAGVDVRTIGWEPGCTCGRTDTVPCVVLDPFVGTGTTLSVAQSLGRSGIGIELNPKWAADVRRRLAREAAPSTYRDDSPTPTTLTADHAEHAPLFAAASEVTP